MKKCSNCKTGNVDVAIYCTHCRNPLQKNSSVDNWKIAFYILGTVMMFLFVAPLFSDNYAEGFFAIASMAATIVGFLILVGLGLTLFFVPSIIAFKRSHHNQVPILLVNILFGASVLGWIIALIWATTAVNPYLKKV